MKVHTIAGRRRDKNAVAARDTRLCVLNGKETAAPHKRPAEDSSTLPERTKID